MTARYAEVPSVVFMELEDGGRAPDERTAGQSATLDEAFREHGPYLVKLGVRLLGDVQDAEDLLQDVFVRAARTRSALRDREALRPWLRRIAVRLAWRKLRRRRLQRLFGAREPIDYGQVPAEGVTADERALIADIYRALDTVPAALRVAWLLRYAEGEPLEVVAEACGCSLATVKRRIREAQVALDRRLGP